MIFQHSASVLFKFAMEFQSTFLITDKNDLLFSHRWSSKHSAQCRISCILIITVITYTSFYSTLQMVSAAHWDQDRWCSFQTSTCHLVCMPRMTLYKPLLVEREMIHLLLLASENCTGQVQRNIRLSVSTYTCDTLLLYSLCFHIGR